MRSMRRFGMLALTFGIGASPAAADVLHRVDCDQRGHSVEHALKRANPGDTIRVTGTCRAHVVITTDRLAPARTTGSACF